VRGYLLSLAKKLPAIVISGVQDERKPIMDLRCASFMSPPLLALWLAMPFVDAGCVCHLCLRSLFRFTSAQFDPGWVSLDHFYKPQAFH
jgi:hypothetical protein